MSRQRKSVVRVLAVLVIAVPFAGLTVAAYAQDAASGSSSSSTRAAQAGITTADPCLAVASEFEALLASNYPSPLETITVNACASGCPRHGYNINVEDDPWFEENDPPPMLKFTQRLDLHGTFNHLLRAMRNAAAACPAAVIRAPAIGEMTLGDLLWHQTEMMLRHESARYYDSTLRRLAAAQIHRPGRNTIDPSKIYSLTWVSEGGKAHRYCGRIRTSKLSTSSCSTAGLPETRALAARRGRREIGTW